MNLGFWPPSWSSSFERNSNSTSSSSSLSLDQSDEETSESVAKPSLGLDSVDKIPREFECQKW